MKEIWKPITDYSGYEVSSSGVVRHYLHGNYYKNLQWLSSTENINKALNDGLVKKCIQVKELTSGKVYRSINNAEAKLGIQSNKLHTQFYKHRQDKAFVATVDGFKFIRVDSNV